MPLGAGIKVVCHHSWPMAKLLLGNELVSHELKWDERREIPGMSGFFLEYIPFSPLSSCIMGARDFGILTL